MTKPEIPIYKNFNGKRYKRVMEGMPKHIAEKNAIENRKRGWLARVVEESSLARFDRGGKFSFKQKAYSIYVRKGDD